MPPKLSSHYVNMDNGRRAIRLELVGYCLILAVSASSATKTVANFASWKT